MLICCALAIAKRDLHDMAGPCFVCNAAVAPFGFGWPGFGRDKPEGKRGYLWTCADHHVDGEQRRQAAITASYCQVDPTPKIIPATIPVKGTKE